MAGLCNHLEAFALDSFVPSTNLLAMYATTQTTSRWVGSAPMQTAHHGSPPRVAPWQQRGEQIVGERGRQAADMSNTSPQRRRQGNVPKGDLDVVLGTLHVSCGTGPVLRQSFGLALPKRCGARRAMRGCIVCAECIWLCVCDLHPVHHETCTLLRWCPGRIGRAS